VTFEWIKIIASGFVGFVAACVVQLISLHSQELTQKKLLRKSLYRELVTIYIGLPDLLPHLDMAGPFGREPNPANLHEFVKAECFNAAKSSPVFWRLNDAVHIVQAQRHFGFLAVSKPQDVRSAAIDVGIALNMFRGMIDSGKLCRHDLLESAGGQLSETELTVPEAAGAGGGLPDSPK
jgi:hypothetical protein